METQQYCQCRWLIVGVLVCQPVSLCLLIIRDAQIADIRRRWALTHVHRGFFSLFSLEKSSSHAPRARAEGGGWCGRRSSVDHKQHIWTDVRGYLCPRF